MITSTISWLRTRILLSYMPYCALVRVLDPTGLPPLSMNYFDRVKIIMQTRYNNQINKQTWNARKYQGHLKWQRSLRFRNTRPVYFGILSTCYCVCLYKLNWNSIACVYYWLVPFVPFIHSEQWLTLFVSTLFDVSSQFILSSWTSFLVRMEESVDGTTKQFF